MQQLIKLKPIFSLLAATIMLFFMMVLIGKVLIPFIAALILGYILNPLVDKLETKFTIKRKYSALIFSLLTLMIFLAIPIYIIPVLITQFKVVIHNTPQIIAVINNNNLTKFNLQFGTHLSLDLEDLKQMVLANQKQISNNLDMFTHLAQNGLIVIEIVVYVVLIPFVLFYSIMNWNNIVNFFDEMIPRSFLFPIHQLCRDIDLMLSAYLRGQLSVMLIMASYYAIALNIVSLPSGTVIGIITGLLVFIPYLGVLSGLLFALTIGLSQFTGSGGLVAILCVYAIGHVLEGALVTPFLVGGRIGLNPVMIILCLMVFGKVFGIVGVLLALPLSTITVVLLRHAKQYYKNTNYYRDAS